MAHLKPADIVSTNENVASSPDGTACTLEYGINIQQILFKFWILAHLHACFVLHNSKKKYVAQNLFFTTYLVPTSLFGLHVYSVFRAI